MTRPLALLIACLLIAGFAACADEDEQAATPTPEDTGGEQGTGCAPAPTPEREVVDVPKPKQRLDPASTYVATVTTNCGTFEITLDAERAPKTGGAFKALADAGFFDGLTFHRIVQDFVVQGGDPSGDGSGGPGWSIVEPPPSNLTYAKGVVAMAKKELDPPGTSGSQFFVVTGPKAAQLSPDYALLGRVTAGQEVVDLIGVAPVAADGKPVEPIVMESVEVN